MREREKGEILGEKLRRNREVSVVAQNTPVLLLAGGGGVAQYSSKVPPFPPPPPLSARKISLPGGYHSYSKMHNGVSAPPPPRLRRLRHRKDKAVDFPDPSPSSPELPGSASSFGGDITASLLRYQRALERKNHALQPDSPASYGSSMEMGPYNPAETPTTSVDFKGRNGDACHSSLKTSTELIKVLNRIWSLEEQHASNVSQVKEMRRELDYSRTRIKELLRLQQADRHEIEDLRNKIAEYKVLGKNKEHDRIIAAVQSVRSELEDERKLRKRSESLHRKLAAELSDAKKSLSCSLKDLEIERKSRVFLEDLCDEFARGIKGYEEEMHGTKQKNGDRTDQSRLILHLSESWLDHRVQKEKGDVVERFGSEMENFLQASNRRSSLESIPLNTIVSAPPDVGGGDEPSSGNSHCFEFVKPSSSALKQGEEIEKEKVPSSRNNSPWRGMASPIRQWTTRLPSQDVDDIVQLSSKLSPPPDLRENTLKEKLLEARKRGQRSRLKASKSPF